MKVLQLGTMVKDTISNTKGMLTNLIIHVGGNKEYIFQPSGLSPATGQPVDKFWLTEERISGGKFIDVDVPMEILGTDAEDIATGFKGKVSGIIYHINGCLHITIKPQNILKATGATVDSTEFDIRRVKGPKIKPQTQKELVESRKKTPSPLPVPKRKF